MPPAYFPSGVRKFIGTCLVGDRIAWIWWGPFHQDRHNWKWSSSPSSLSPGNSRKGCSCPLDSSVMWQVGTQWLFLFSAWSQATCKINPSATFSSPDFWKIQLELHNDALSRLKPRRRAPKNSSLQFTLVDVAIPGLQAGSIKLTNAQHCFQKPASQ